MNIRLWHSPYNGGWIWFDKAQWKRFSCGWRPQIGSTWKGGTDPVLWWCFFGFCGKVTLQTWPWQSAPEDDLLPCPTCGSEGRGGGLPYCNDCDPDAAPEGEK